MFSSGLQKHTEPSAPDTQGKREKEKSFRAKQNSKRVRQVACGSTFNTVANVPESLM